jgi:hypothetical protein
MIPSITGFETSIPVPLLIALMLWEAVWKGIGLWKAGGHRQLAWFIAMFVLNTVGILPIVYIVWFQKSSKKASMPARPTKKKKR